MFSVPPYPSAPIQGPFRGTIQLLSHCPLCHAFYQSTSARVLAENDDAHLVHLECGSCGGAIVAVIIANILGVSSVGLITDLTPDDVLKFRSAEPVGSDDLLDLHEYFADERGPLPV